MGVTLYGAFFVVFFNALVDIAYAYLDPRVRLGESGHRHEPAPLLSVRDLRVGFATEGGRVQAVDGVCFELRPGEVLAIVGESGSGKSVTAQTMIGLTRSHNSRIEGSVKLERQGADRRRPTPSCSSCAGEQVAMIFQDPMTSFNPVYRLGAQIVEAIRAHRPTSSKQDGASAGDRAARRGRDPRRRPQRVDDYPHEFSGGMRQRAMIAMALALEPERADRRRADHGARRDDPGADPRPAAQDLNRERGLATILITHDLGVVAEVADRVLVMYGGKVVEQGTLDEIFYDPQHPYTWGLLGSLTRLDRPRPQRLPQISGAPPSLLDLPEGCAFRPRCPHEFGKCTRGAGARGAPGRRTRPPRSLLARARSRSASKRQVEGRIGLEAPCDS